MVTAIGFTSIDITREEKKKLIAALNSAGRAVFSTDFYMMLRWVPEEFSSKKARNLITFVLSIPASVTIEEKRRISVGLHEAMIEVLGRENNERVTILFWPVEEDEIGIDGVLCCDRAALGKGDA